MMELETTLQTITIWAKNSGSPGHPDQFEISSRLGFAQIDQEVISRTTDNSLYLTILLKFAPKEEHKPHLHNVQ